MRRDRRLPRQVAATLLAAALIAGYPLGRYASPGTLLAVCLGCGLSTLNVLLGYAAVEYSFGKSSTVFLRTVLGGMGLRLLLMLGLLVLLILVFHVDAVPLTVSVLGFYAVFLILEVLYLQRKVLVQNQG